MRFVLRSRPDLVVRSDGGPKHATAPGAARLVLPLRGSASRAVSGRGTPTRAGRRRLRKGKFSEDLGRLMPSAFDESGNGRGTNRRWASIHVLFSLDVEGRGPVGARSGRGGIVRRSGCRALFIIPSRIGTGLIKGKSRACRPIHASAKRRTMRRRIIDTRPFPDPFSLHMARTGRRGARCRTR